MEPQIYNFRAKNVTKAKTLIMALPRRNIYIKQAKVMKKKKTQKGGEIIYVI